MATHIENGQLKARNEGQLFAGQVVERFNDAVARSLEQIIQQAAEDLGMRRENASKCEVIFHVREQHGAMVPRCRSMRKRRGGFAAFPSALHFCCFMSLAKWRV